MLVATVVGVAVKNRDPVGDPGRLTEPVIDLPVDLRLPVFADATNEWGLGDPNVRPADDQMAGGSAVADYDRDGDVDLAVANGDVVVFAWTGAGYGAGRSLGFDAAIGVTSADLDLDGFADLLIATDGRSDAIVWGGEWLVDGSAPTVTSLDVPGASSGLLAGELSGDGRIDVVRLGRGLGLQNPVPDVLWVASEADRGFEPIELPVGDRFTLAGELVDADQDGLLDIWLTRDVGWARGADSVLSRRGDPSGEWVDVAAELGVDLEVDGMGITIADLNGDAELDAYVSDLGDNELLLGSSSGFTPAFDSGAAHIRPAGAPESSVSSTWGTGAFDANLDGIVDLVLASGGFPSGSVRNKIEGTEVIVDEPPSLLLGVGDGTYVDVWDQLGMDIDLVGRGLSVADLDGDGDDDVVLVDRRGSVHVLRNDTSGPTVTVAASAGCDTAGIVVTVMTPSRTFQRLLAPHGYASAHGFSVSVGGLDGLSTSGSSSIEVRWPDGSEQRLTPPAGDRVQVTARCS